MVFQLLIALTIKASKVDYLPHAQAKTSCGARMTLSRLLLLSPPQKSLEIISERFIILDQLIK